jgi:hypothetical protein
MASEPFRSLPVLIQRSFLLAAFFFAMPIASLGGEESPKELFGEAVRLF